MRLRAALVPLLFALSSAGCSERALEIFDPDAPRVVADAGTAIDASGPRPPGDLPAVYCERMVVLGDGNQLSLFDPVALSFQDTARLDCPAIGESKAYSIALDRDGRLWAAYSRGELFVADPQTGACKATPFDQLRSSMRRFDLAFAPAESASSSELLYLLSLDNMGGGELASLDPTSLAFSPIDRLPTGMELTTTGSGELWGLSRGAAPHAYLLDKQTGKRLRELSLGSRLGNLTGYGVGFSWFRDQFYVFLLPQESTTSVFRTSPIDGATERIASRTGRNLISATAARCF